MAITISGVLGIVLAIPGVTPVVAALAGAYFVYLAIRIAMAPPLEETAAQRQPPSFGGGVFLSLVNPKAYAMIAALFSGFVLARERLVLDVSAKVVVLAAIIVTVNLSWLFAGAALTRFFREPRLNRAINVTFAILLVASVAFALPL